MDTKIAKNDFFKKFWKSRTPHGQFSRNRHPTWKKKIQNFFQNFLKMVLRYTKNVKKIFFSIFVVFLQIWSQYLNFSWKRLENFSKNFENHHFLVQILKYMQKSDPLQSKPKKIQKNVLNKKCPQLPFGKSQKISEC